ncbi:uncharacterized protein LOC122508626 isoform X2 [Leptopilina heterotoma]|nr:uncharacterized protein LOC122508626 isoform X2 [Leptopilina heterotoma]
MNDNNELADKCPKYNLKGIQAHRSCDQILLDSSLSFNSKKNKNDSPLLTVKKLFVTNLADKATLEDLLKIFKIYGEVSECVIKKNRKSNYAFVTFTNVDSAKNALKKENGRSLHGKNLTVIPADPRHQPNPKKPPNEKDEPKKGQTENSCSSGEIYPLIHKISDTCLMHIFQYLSIAERIKVEGVCRRWRDVSLDSWRTLKRLDVNSISWGCKSGKIETSDLYQILKRCGRYITTITFFEKHRMMPLRTLFIIGKCCPNLKIAYLGTLEVTPREIDYILSQCPNLEFLEFDSSHFRDRDFRRLFAMSNQLKYASVEKSKIDGSCFTCLPENVETFVFHEAKRRTEFYAFEFVVKRLKNLENLYLNFSNDSDEGLPTFEEDDDDDDEEDDDDNDDYGNNDSDIDDDIYENYDYFDENDEFLDENDVFLDEEDNFDEEVDDFHDEEDDFHDEEDNFDEEVDDFHDEEDDFHDEEDDFHDEVDDFQDDEDDFHDFDDGFDSNDEDKGGNLENSASQTSSTFKTASGKMINSTTSKEQNSKVSPQKKENEKVEEDFSDINSTITDELEPMDDNSEKSSSKPDSNLKTPKAEHSDAIFKDEKQIPSDESFKSPENRNSPSTSSVNQSNASKIENSPSKSSENQTSPLKSSENQNSSSKSSENRNSTSKQSEKQSSTLKITENENSSSKSLDNQPSTSKNGENCEEKKNEEDKKEELISTNSNSGVTNNLANESIDSLDYYVGHDDDDDNDNDYYNGFDDYDDDDIDDEYDNFDDYLNDHYDQYDYGFNDFDVEDDFIFESHLAETIRQTLMHCNTKLKILQLKSCSFAGLTSHDLLTKITNFTHLERLDFSDNAIVTDEILSAIGANCPKLNVLLINRCFQVSDVGIGGIALLPELKHLSMNDLSKVTGKQLSTLCTLKTLYCARCPSIVADGLVKLIANCHELEQLDIQCCKLITNSFIIDNVASTLNNRKNNIKLKIFARATGIDVKILSAIIKNNVELMELSMEFRQEKFDSFIDGNRGTEKTDNKNGLELRDFRGMIFESSTFKEDKED